jgi:hypothetical protein
MAETPEIPEPQTENDKPVALTIAILAVIISLVGNTGDNAKTDAIIKTTESANQWAYFQAKGVREAIYTVQADALELALPAKGDAQKANALIKDYRAKVKIYQDEKEALGPGRREPYGSFKALTDVHGVPIISATQLSEESHRSMRVNDTADRGMLFLQLAVILCSLAIL